MCDSTGPTRTIARVGDQEAPIIVLPTYLVIYGSQFLHPNHGERSKQFELLANAMNVVNKKKHPGGKYVVADCTTTYMEFFDAIHKHENIVKLDVYSHGFTSGLNLGGFTGRRMVDGRSMNSTDIDWVGNPSIGRNLRTVGVDKLDYLTPDNFTDKAKVYFWGCNIGGQITEGKHVARQDDNYLDPQESFAHKFAVKMGKGKVYAVVGRVAKGASGGTVYRRKNEVFFDTGGQMLPASIGLGHSGGNTYNIDAYEYMKEFAKDKTPVWKNGREPVWTR